jgi:hypothetical protein
MAGFMQKLGIGRRSDKAADEKTDEKPSERPGE